MATSGEAVTNAELEARSNRLAHLLRARGLVRLINHLTSGEFRSIHDGFLYTYLLFRRKGRR
jgi:hypothetical protein